ncbi:MAG: type IV toxin-antitoxin system AbiEi family antitoxin domain-containing protein, partial [Pseudolysinimonas sp.]
MPIITYRELRRAGASRPDIERMLRDGTLLRLRTGWYASADTRPDVMGAVRMGGSLSCGAALRSHGVWAAPG